MKRIYLGLFLIVSLFASQAYGQTNTYIGGFNGSWDTAGLWSLGIVPTAAHDVQINGANEPVIGAGVVALAQSVTVAAGLRLDIRVGGSLTVNGGIININGGLRNQGTLNVSNASTGIIYNGTGGFDNDGSMVISNVVNNGIFINGTGARNDGSIVINNANFGFNCLANFSNFSTITISTVAINGLRVANSANFTNRGPLTIFNDTADNAMAIRMEAGTQLTSWGNIDIDDFDNPTSIGIINVAGSLTFMGGSVITIDNIAQSAINLSNGSFTNNGDLSISDMQNGFFAVGVNAWITNNFEIDISSFTANGIHTSAQARLINRGNGVIDIHDDSNGSFGIISNADCFLDNEGDITITNMSASVEPFWPQGTVDNMATGVISISNVGRSAINRQGGGGPFANNGQITITNANNVDNGTNGGILLWDSIVNSGNIDITNTNRAGILVTNTGDLFNTSTGIITIDNVPEGIENLGSLTNQPGGQINISNTTGRGLQCFLADSEATNGGTITLTNCATSTGSAFDVNSSTQFNNQGPGTININNGGVGMSIALCPFLNFGAINIDGTSSTAARLIATDFQLNGVITLTNIVNPANDVLALTSNALLFGNGGTFNGGLVDVVGRVSPGNGDGLLMGRLTVNGDIDFSSIGARGIFSVDGNAGPGFFNGHDQLIVSGNVILGAGTIETMTDGFVPGAGDCYVVIDGSSGLSSTFGAENHLNYSFDVQYDVPNANVELCTNIPSVSCSIVGTNVLCNGASTGAANATVSGGTGSYTYSWSNGAMTEDISNIPAGTYTLTVTDTGGDMSSCSVTITQPPTAPSCATSNIMNVSVAGGSDGSFDVTATGGTPGYSYDILNSASTVVANGNIATSGGMASITGLPADAYTVQITDANGCMTTCNANITQPGAMTCSIVGTNVLCNGASTGAANATISGGDGSYTYSWSNGAMTEDLTNISAGSYTLTVTDGAGAMTSCSVTITQPPTAPTCATSNVMNVSVAGGSDGSFDVTATGGTPGYTYDIVNSASAVVANGNIATSGGMASITGLPADAYTVEITDANGCMTTCNATITQPGAMSCSIVGTNVLCNGASTGAANASISGGNGTYTYSWSNGAMTEDLSNISAGSYTLTVTDGAGAMTNCSVTITQPPTAVSCVTSNIMNVSIAGGSDGSFDVTTTGGTAGYSYDVLNSASASVANGNIATSGGMASITGLPADAYTVQITDANGCMTSCNANITQPGAMSCSIVGTNVLCNGASTGAANATISGGDGSYTYSWSNGAMTEDLSNIPAGSYTLTVTDGAGAMTNCSVTITQPPTAPSCSTSNIMNVSVAGGSDGSFDVTATGGTAGYSYDVLNSASTSVANGNIATSGGMASITGLVADSYTVEITDANGCVTTCNATITQPGVLSCSILGTNVLCNGASTGAANATITGGNGSFTYSWSNGAMTEDLSNVPAGTYTLTVSDSAGAMSNCSVTITQPATVVSCATSNIMNVTIFGGSNGSFDITANDGTAGYTFDVLNSTGTVVANGNIATSGGVASITGLVADVYTVEVTDANGCLTICNATITQPSALSCSILGTNVLCNGDSTGAANATISGGNGSYIYSWSNGAMTEDVTNIPAGSYTLTVTDSAGAMTSCSVTITQPPTLPSCVTSNIMNVTIFGGSNGSFDVTATGGTPGYSYDVLNSASTVVANGNIATSGGIASITGLPADTYTVQITDANGCMTTCNAIITQPALLTCTITGTDVLCFGASTGAANAIISGGNGSFTYSWSNGAITEDLTNIPAGTYTLTVSDSAGAFTNCSVTITEPTTAVSCSIVGTNIQCNGTATGSANATVVGGSPPYSYAWSNGAMTEDISNIPAGNYVLTVTDNDGCVTNCSVRITELPAISCSIAATNVDCNGNSTGAADATVGGGTAPYQYLWSNGATTEDISNVPAGTYTLTITDANSCVSTCSVTITEPAVLSCSIAKTDVDCNGNSTGIANATIVGGTAPYMFSWSNGETTEDISNLPAGVYRLDVTDRNGCRTSCQVRITEPPLLSCSIVGFDADCNGASTGAANAAVRGGTPPYMYSWSNGETTEDISDIPAGNYVLTVTDANGCVTNCSVQIDEPALLTCSLVKTDVLCNGDSTGSIQATIAGGTRPYRYSWSSGQSTRNINRIPAGSYTLTVTDANDCVSICSITVDEPPFLGGMIVQDIIPCEDDFATITVTPVGGVAPYTVLWENGETTTTIDNILAGRTYVDITDSHDCVTREYFDVEEYPEYDIHEVVEICEGQSYMWPDLSAAPIEAGEYMHVSELLTINNCDSIINTTLRIHRMQFADAFSPNNGNGVNDRFILLNDNNCDISNFNIQIFNRWGELVYESADPQEGWDGRHDDRKGNPGLYTYVAEFETLGNKINKMGSIHLLD